MIRARGLTKRFGAHQVLNGVDLDVDRGARVAVLGLNGAGKTTLMRCLLGLTSFGGFLSLAGHDVRAAGRAARAALGYVPQRVPHFDGTLADTVEFFARIREIDLRRVGRRLDALDLGLAEHGAKPIRTLSGGMLQKVLLALALAADVPLLLLDEPTANLDPRARREFLRALTHVDQRTTILLASHRFADVAAVANRLLVLHEGHIVFDGSLETLWRRVGRGITLWVKVPPAERDRAQRTVESRRHIPAVRHNGAALGIPVERTGGADLLVALRHQGIRIEEFWTETPSLHDLLEGILHPGRER